MMNTFKNTILGLFLVIGSVNNTSAESIPTPITTLNVTLDSQPVVQLRFAKAPRASQSVMAALKQLEMSTLDIHWQTSGLYDLTTPLALKKETLMRLANEEDYSTMSNKSRWRQLRQYIRKMAFGKKITTSIDPDITRIDPVLNPIITGNWILSMQSKANSVLVLGAVKHMGEQPWQQRHDANTYAEAAGLLDTPLSNLTVIQPDGHVETHHISYWNRQFKEVSPGSIVYVAIPHAHQWFEVGKPNLDTNQVVIELLRNRLP